MSQRKVFVLLVVLLSCASTGQAANYTDTIGRGQTLNRALSPGDTWTVYYNPDGTYPTLIAGQAPGWYYIQVGLGGNLNSLGGSGTNVPLIQMVPSIWGPRVGWQSLYQSFYVGASFRYGSLTGVKGTQYGFQFRCYQASTVLYVSVN